MPEYAHAEDLVIEPDGTRLAGSNRSKPRELKELVERREPQR